jgi:hypothetical protein
MSPIMHRAQRRRRKTFQSKRRDSNAAEALTRSPSQGTIITLIHAPSVRIEGKSSTAKRMAFARSGVAIVEPLTRTTTFHFAMNSSAGEQVIKRHDLAFAAAKHSGHAMRLSWLSLTTRSCASSAFLIRY